MKALFLALLLFLWFSVVGKAVLEAVRFRISVLRGWLLASPIGFATIEILVCFLNQVCGMPVKVFAFWLLLALAIGCALVFWLRRPPVPWRQMLPFQAAVCFSLVYTGWPALLHGFNWLSYVNGDMTYFAGGAVRMLENPFYRMPTLEELVGKDYTQYTWSAHVVFQIRFGGEVLLAWCSGMTGLNPLEAYMPLIMALHASQVCAAAGLVLTRIRLRKTALLTSILLSLSPMFSLGSLYQLLPQMGGLPLMLTITALLTTGPFRPAGYWRSPFCVVLAIALSGICLHYPEVGAFALLGSALYWSIQLLRERTFPLRLLACFSISLALVVILIRENTLTGIKNTLLNVQTAGLTGVAPGASIFPQFMIPSGLPNLLGLLPFGYYPREPLLSTAILVSILVLCALLAHAGRQMWYGYPHACLLVFMFVMGISFFFGQNDYGLFKLAMFIQPPLAASLAFLFFSRLRGVLWVGPIVVLMATGFSQGYITRLSSGSRAGGMVEVPLASQLGMDFAVPRASAVSDINQPPAQGIAAIIFRGAPVIYPSVCRGKLSAADGPESGSISPASTEPLRASHPRHSVSLRAGISSLLQRIEVTAQAPSRRFVPAFRDQEERRRLAANRPAILWGAQYFEYSNSIFGPGHPEPEHFVSLRTASIFNGLSPPLPGRDYGMFHVASYADVRNRVLFIPSSRGSDYYYERFNASFYQPEGDYYQMGFLMAAFGRFALFEVLKPSPQFRVRLSITRTILGSGRVQLPSRALLEAESRARIPFSGCGAANVYSEPVTPLQSPSGRFYFAVDMGMPAISFPSRKSGLMRLYNQEWALDHRKLVAFCRDISVIREEEYRRLPRARKIEKFPSDLLSNAGLEFSGIYEDGWFSQESFVRLGARGDANRIVLRGSVPGYGALMDGTNIMKVRINDQAPQSFEIEPGNFTVAARVEGAEPTTLVRITFSRSAVLPSPDERPVSALMEAISLEP